LYKGQPKDTQRDFPWPGSSNIVVQLIAENADIVKAIMLGSIHEVLPLWVAGLVGDFKPDEEGEEQRSAVERFMDLMGLKKDELDIYRVESLAASDIAQFGTVAIKLPWQTDIEMLVTGTDNEGKITKEKITKYDGPRPEKLAIEDWACTPTAPTIDRANFKYHYYKMHKQDIQEEIFLGHIDKKVGEELLKNPDRDGLNQVDTDKLKAQNIDAPMPVTSTAEWDVYECWFWYWHNDAKYRIIYKYHLGTRKKLKAVFNFYSNNDEPWELGRLGYTDDGIMGYGFAEMLEHYQEDVSTKHNQRADNGTLQNTSIVLTGHHSKLGGGFGIFPMATLPVNPDEFSIEQLGTQAGSSVNEEELTIALAKARCGTNMPDSGGTGSGTVNKKGAYSSMGTFAVLQMGTRRVNINITDFRYLHLNVGQKCLKEYAEFGIGDRLKYLGEQAKYLQKALDNIKKGRLELPIRAATASINKEVEKQNGMLFVNVMQRHYGAVAQILQGIQNPVMPPEMKEYLLGSIGGMAYIMSKLLRAFGYDDINRMQPELEILKKIKGAGPDGQRNVSQSTESNKPNGQQQSLPANNKEPGTGAEPTPAAGVQNPGGVLQ
jgi:hypothetical protein